jgi:hypothetical protein
VPDIELGDRHALWFTQFAPDRALNPQYEGIADVPRYSAVIEHFNKGGTLCLSAIHFDTPEVCAVDAASKRHCEQHGISYRDYPRWKVECWEPLTVSPSLLCSCGDHGWIRAGCWVRA